MSKLFLVGCIFFAFLAGIFTSKAQTGSIPEGMKPYTPTRLEWLAATMEAQMRDDLTGPTDFSMDFVASSNQNTLLIYVRYLPTARREIMNLRIENARKVVAIESEAKGWNSWLKVREDVKMTEPLAK
jgi:hypothetical protein